MGSLGWYIFRTTFGAFLLILVSLTSVIWVTQALHDVDLVTNQGQGVLAFISITGLIVPLLVMVIAPIALMIAATYSLNKLSTDSEIIVMNAAGMSPWRLFRPFLASAFVVTAIVALTSAYLSPKGLRELRRQITQVQANLISKIVQPGHFLALDKLTFHIRERRVDGVMLGILIDDRSDPKQRATILAEQGEILTNAGGTFLVMENGSIQRHSAGEPDPSIVTFERYAFDLSHFTGLGTTITYTAREQYLWELLLSDPAKVSKDDLASIHAEINDRIAAPIYPLAFAIIIYAYLGAPRTTRQSRALSMIGCIGAVAALRFIGFASVIVGVKHPAAFAAQYLGLLITFALGCYVIHSGSIIEPPKFIDDFVTFITERLAALALRGRESLRSS